MSTLCLCMIVRNEARVIGRALDSVRELVDYWVVCDTGSTDETPMLVLEHLNAVPGELHRCDWMSFGHNREEALRLARPHADYSLILDADMVANLRGELPALDADWYELRYEGAIDYSQPMLLSNAHAWEYVGVTHEYVRSPTAHVGGTLPELTLIHLGDGEMRDDKFERDIRLLEQAHAEDPGDERTVFYLGQSHWDRGDPERALEWYERRVAQGGGWSEELWYARFRVAEARRALGANEQDVAAAYLDAYAARPSRIEPLYALARACRQRGDFALGHLMACAGEHAPYPADRLFIDREVYMFRLALERGLCALGLGRVSDAVRGFNAVLGAPDVPDWAADAAIRGLERADALACGSRAVVGEPNPIKVVVAFRNPGHFLDACVESLLEQDYEHFTVVAVDDASDDGSGARLPVNDPRFVCLRNEVRLGGAGSVHRAVSEACRPEDVVVHVDGDDWLACPDALRYVDEQYRRHDCWVMYGQFRCSTGDYGLCRPFASATEFGRARETWVTSHVKTYRAGLFHRIAEQDPEYACLKDASGAWLDAAVDAALMFPLLELAGFERTRYSPRVLYVYNADNPASVHRARFEHQTAVYEDLQRRRRFVAVESYEPARVGAC